VSLKRKSVDDTFIGKGEKTAVKILKKIFPKDDIEIQVPFKNLMKGEFLGALTERQQKQTLDIVIFGVAEPFTLVVRVQGKNHTGEMTASRDLVQKKMLEWNDCKVIDLWFYDCPVLWKEKLNDDSIKEVKFALKSIKM
jgi:hypothetical protein